MKGKKIYLLMIGILMWAVLCVPNHKMIASYVKEAADTRVVVLDAGHGGVDGGAVSADGTSEKDINLAIAQNMKKRLEAEDIKVIMTRNDENGLYNDSQNGAVRTLKTEDMRIRKEIMDDAKADLAVSIHLNSFTQDSSVKGAQVFYPLEGDDGYVADSKTAARLLQKKLNEEINIDKKRTELGKNDVFLLKNINSPIVIVECGFLSNDEDAANLKEEKFQRKVSEILSKSVCQYLEKAGNKK